MCSCDVIRNYLVYYVSNFTQIQMQELSIHKYMHEIYLLLLQVNTETHEWMDILLVMSFFCCLQNFFYFYFCCSNEPAGELCDLIKLSKIQFYIFFCYCLIHKQMQWIGLSDNFFFSCGYGYKFMRVFLVAKVFNVICVLGNDFIIGLRLNVFMQELFG